MAKKICDRKRGVGADGLLLLEKSKRADIRMRIFNPDGSEADMCGNGVRCLAKFAVSIKAVKAKHSVETPAGPIELVVEKKTVKAHLTDPKDFKAGFSLPLPSGKEEIHFINTGVPHAVIFEAQLSRVQVHQRGRQVREHDYFAPKGTNVNFVQAGGGNLIQVRTYERGVEAETLACGTGSAASALVAASRWNLNSPVSVKTSGGETLKIYFKKEKQAWKDVWLEGEVQTVFEGRVAI